MGDFTEATEPFALFAGWLLEAEGSEPNDPNGMALATVDADGLPNIRMVLMKDFDEDGFVFYTNFESAKGRELLSQRKGALLFHWKSLRRQVRVRGEVEVVTDAEADAYYATRPRQSRLGAWASRQSRPLESRFALEKAVAAVALQYPLGDIPRPADRDRVLEGRRLPPARPRRLPPRRGGRGGMEQGTALSVGNSGQEGGRNAKVDPA